MFFFFVGGVNQQVREVLKRGVGRCIVCGSPADLVEYEKVLKVFFLPVKSWPGKEPALHCENCKLFFPQSLAEPPTPERRLPSVTDVLTCPFCSREVDSEFRFCPFCGSALYTKPPNAIKRTVLYFTSVLMFETISFCL